MEKNGKLFGKINLIDLLVLLVALLAVAFLGMKLSGGNDAVVASTTEILYTAKVDGVDREVYENVLAFVEQAKQAGAEGDQLLAGGELINGYVVDVTATDRDDQVEFVINNQNVAVTNVKDRVDVTFTIKGQVENANTTELGTQEIRVGKGHIVKTTHFELTNAIVTSCEWIGGTGFDLTLSGN